jgi:hypothetical protein
MPGREDFGIVRSRARLDPRVHAAADFYVKARLARRETALSAVLGDIACLGCDLARETDDGVIPGSPAFFFAQATGRGGRAAERSLRALQEAGLLTDSDAGLRLRGFEDAFGPLISDREAARERRAKKRAKERAKRLGKAGEGRGFAEPSPNRRGTIGDGSPVTGTVRYGPVRSPSDSGHGGESAARTEATAEATTTAIPEDLKRRYRGGRGGVSEAAWGRQLHALLADGVQPEKIAEALDCAGSSSKPWEVLKGLKKEEAKRQRAEASARGRKEVARERHEQEVAYLAQDPVKAAAHFAKESSRLEAVARRDSSPARLDAVRHGQARLAKLRTEVEAIAGPLPEPRPGPCPRTGEGGGRP